MTAQLEVLKTRSGWGRVRAVVMPTPPHNEQAYGPVTCRPYRRPCAVGSPRPRGRSFLECEQGACEARANLILARKLDYMYDPSFDAPDAASNILGPMPELPDGQAPRRAKAPKGLLPYLADLYKASLLTLEQETYLFRKMNYLKYKAGVLSSLLVPARATSSELDEIERLQEEALAIRNQILRANLRLVVSIAKRYVSPSDNFFELISDGNVSFIRAVEKFDFGRGNKFSTYASRAIMKNYARTIPKENRFHGRFVTGHEGTLEIATDTRADERECQSSYLRMQEDVRRIVGRLDGREQRIITGRFGLGGSDEQTLAQLSRELGITKERVRQLEVRALEKLNGIARQQNIALL